MATTDSSASAGFDRFLSRGKDLVALFRDGSIMVLAVTLIAFPQTLNDMLVQAGFEEGSVVGFKWKARLLQSDDALKNARATIDTLQSQLQKTTEALNAANATQRDPALKEKIQNLEQENRQATSASSQVQTSVSSTIASNAPLVEKAQTTAYSGGNWGMVFGSDVSLAAARDEIARAAKQGIPNAAIYRRNGYYASIAVVEDRSLAAQYLATAKRFRPDAYITPMATWCKQMQQENGFIDCASTR